MEIVVNGQATRVPEGTTAAGLLEQLRVPAERVVVERNLTILKRHELGSTALQSGDTIEIVHFVGGG